MNEPTAELRSDREERLSDLLLQWEEQYDAGNELSATDLCGDDKHLQVELAKRIDKLKQMNRVLDHDNTIDKGDTNRGDNTLSPTPAAPPGYELLEEIGRGGMGVVYKARQLSLDRIVALKMILAGEFSATFHRERFRTEAETVARLQHANILQIHDVGEHNDLPFCALEFMAGGTLATKLSGKPLQAEKAASLVMTLSRAVQVAHEKSIIHRDLKPANILLGEKGEVKIADFGLAKCLDANDSNTRTGDILGTPSYMAPEQASGKISEIGVAADVYALGAILYETLTGRPPFRAASAIDTIMQVANNDPAPPSQLQPNVPRDLETICLKCLHKSPGHRYESAAALADDLQRYLAGEPIVARPVGAIERTLKYARRNPAIAAIVGIVFFGLVAGLTTVALYNSRLQAEQIKLAKANTLLTNQSDDLRQAKATADQQRSAALAALEEKNRLLSLSFVAYGRACSLAAKIANLDDSVVISSNRATQISQQALVQFKLQRDLLQKAGDPAIQPALNAYWNALQKTKRPGDELKQLSLNLANACGDAWQKETAALPELQQSIRAHLYARTCDAADRLANADDLSKVNHSYDEFWELYWGELAIVESKSVEKAMVNFGEYLKQKKSGALAENEPLKLAAAKLRAACGLAD